MGVTLLGKIKIHEIAKKLGLASKEVVAKANEIGIKVTSHLSSVDEEQEKKILEKFNFKSQKAKTEIEKNKSEKVKEEKKTETPVIIRREVIINDSDEKKEQEKKKQEQKRKEVGFVERNNSNYNIVYRNKPQKPLTVNELFGIKDNKKEEVKKEKTKKEDVKQEIKPEIKKEEAKEEKVQVQKLEEENKIEKEKIVSTEIKKEIGENTEKKAMVEDKVQKESVNTGYNGNNNFIKNENRQVNNNNFNKNNDYRQGNNNYRNNNRNNDGQNRYQNNRNNYDNQNRYQNNRNNDGQNRYQNGRNNDGQNRYQNNRNNYDNQNRFQNGRNNNVQRFNNGNGQRNNNFNRNDRRPLDEKGIDKNIKNIMATEIVEKENQRDYSTKSIDKEKLNNRYDENKKKNNKSRKTGRFDEIDGGKLKDLKQVDKLSNMFDEQDGGMLDYYDLTTARGKRNKKKNTKNNEERTKQKIFQLTEITIPESITVKDLAAELKKTSAEVIKKLFGYGIMATINNVIDFDTAFLVASEFGVNAVKKEEVKEEDILFDDSEDSENELEKRPPVVVVMGHVDHGKTSLLDAVRSTNVIEGEAGGITQHIGAYKVNVNGREITFLDTPGHEAFTAMRARGAQITDIAILVVAADDGVMPQTVEAINHAKAAEIPIIVAVNKIDLPGANVEKIKQELMQYELVPEEWGGDTIFVPISAKKHINIENLLEMVLLVADMKDLKANPHKQSKGVVIEARLDKAKGPIASMLVQRGTLDVGDTIVVGTSIGRIRAMKNDKGQMVKKAGPSTPVEIMGLTEVPRAGDTFYEVKNEKMAKHLIERRRRQEREKNLALDNKVTLSNLFEKMENENLKQLNLIVKADVQGTAQAVKQSLEKLSNEEVKVKVIHAVAGAVTESDVQLAKAANAIIIAFNVRPVGTAKEMADKGEVEIKQYSVIYQAIEDVEAAMKGMLDPIFEEKVIGNAEIRQTFKVSNVGTIAGCYVLDGKIERNAGVRIIRDSVVIHEGKLASLKRFKDDAKEVAKGYECGVQIENYNDLKEGDIIEVFVMEQVKR